MPEGKESDITKPEQKDKTGKCYINKRSKSTVCLGLMIENAKHQCFTSVGSRKSLPTAA